MIKSNTSLSGNCSKLLARTSLLEFNIFRAFNVVHNCSKAPSITGVLRQPPNQGWIKINSDGAAIGCSGFARGGGIFRDHEGKFLGGFAGYFGVHDSLYAEVLAAIVAVRIAYSKGWHRVWLEYDSSLLVDIFIHQKAVPWELRNQCQKCNENSLSIQLKVSHIFRECNTCADKLANYGVKFKSDFWWNSTPSFIIDDLNRNRNALPYYRFRNL